MINTFRTFTDKSGRFVAVYYDEAHGLYCEVCKYPEDKTYRVTTEYQRDGEAHGYTVRHAEKAMALDVADAFVTLARRPFAVEGR